MDVGPQIERGTVYRNIRDKWIPREAFFDLGDVKVEKDIGTFNVEENEPHSRGGRTSN